jgi:hypothetical protein
VVKVHRLVALAFLGDPPEGSHCVNHKNGVKTDNRIENLEWISPGGNARHAAALGLLPSREARSEIARRVNPRGEHHRSAKLTAEKVRKIRSEREKGRTYQSLADEYGVDQSSIGAVVKRENWKHVP